MPWQKVTDFDCQVVVGDKVCIEGCDSITVTAIANTIFVAEKYSGVENPYSKKGEWSLWIEPKPIDILAKFLEPFIFSHALSAQRGDKIMPLSFYLADELIKAGSVVLIPIGIGDKK